MRRRSKLPRGKRVAGAALRPKDALAIGPDMLVSLAYRLFDERGELCDEVVAKTPLRYVHGYAQIVPGLERALEGCLRGERRRVELGPDDAFGERDPEALLEIDALDFPDAKPAQVGDEIVATLPDGSECAYRIVSISETDIVADRNHPLAGERVRFEVEVLSVRPATEDELRAAEADVDDRIVYANTIVYGSEPEVPPLVQLRKNPKSGSRP